MVTHHVVEPFNVSHLLAVHRISKTVWWRIEKVCSQLYNFGKQWKHAWMIKICSIHK
jgi:hypothetical protein